MSHVLILSPLAQEDLFQIGSFIEADSPAAAGRFVLAVEQRIQLLRDFPESGRPRPDLGSGLRMFSFDKRVSIVYRIQNRTVTILRVLYGGRELKEGDAGTP